MRMAKCTVQLLNQHCPWFNTKPSDLMQWSMEDLRLDLTWGGELSFLSMVQDLPVSNFRPKLLRFRSTSSYGFSFSVQKTCLCWNKMIFKPQAHVRQEGLTLTKAMNRGQQRVPGAQLGLDIAAQERSESKRWVKGHAQMAGMTFFSPPSYCQYWAHSPSESPGHNDWWVTVQACSTACCEKQGASPSNYQTLLIEIISFT